MFKWLKRKTIADFIKEEMIESEVQMMKYASHAEFNIAMVSMYEDRILRLAEHPEWQKAAYGSKSGPADGHEADSFNASVWSTLRSRAPGPDEGNENRTQRMGLQDQFGDTGVDVIYGDVR